MKLKGLCKLTLTGYKEKIISQLIYPILIKATKASVTHFTKKAAAFIKLLSKDHK